MFLVVMVACKSNMPDTGRCGGNPTNTRGTIMSDIRQAQDNSQYVRQQQGHSLTLHLLLGWVVLWVPAVYYTVSPNHFWHL